MLQDWHFMVSSSELKFPTSLLQTKHSLAAVHAADLMRIIFSTEMGFFSDSTMGPMSLVASKAVSGHVVRVLMLSKFLTATLVILYDWASFMESKWASHKQQEIELVESATIICLQSITCPDRVVRDSVGPMSITLIAMVA